MTITRRQALGGLVASAIAGRPSRAAGRLPSDLTGVAGSPTLAWSLDGFGRDLDVGGLLTADGPMLLVAGRRIGTDAPHNGDLTLVSPRGWLLRRIELPAEVRGLPALIRSVVLAVDAAGTLHLLPLGRNARESVHPRLATGLPATLGPLVLGTTLLLSLGHTLRSVTDRLETQWSAELPEPAGVPPASDGQTVVAAAGNRVLALDAASGQPVWSVATDAPAATALLVSAGLVLAGLADGSVLALDAATGGEVWRQAGGSALAPFAALAGPWLVTSHADGTLRAWEVASGEPSWRAEVPAPAGSPVVAFGHVLVIGGDGALHAQPFDPAQAGWRFGLEGGEAFTGLPGVFGRRVYAGTATGRLVALQIDPAAGPAPWPVPGGTLWRAGRVVPPDESEG